MQKNTESKKKHQCKQITRNTFTLGSTGWDFIKAHRSHSAQGLVFGFAFTSN